VDVLVNNAGVATFEPIAASDSDAWWRTVEVNLKGTYLCSRAVLAHMRDRGSGHIVNILSVAARTPFPSSSAYCASKSAALAFTQVLAAEERSQGIRVTAILPGATRTPFWEAMDTDLDLSAMMPPERVAETVTFVVTQPAGATTGEVLILPPGGIL
jgi:3-oxoacyl-[acyl-carrier protein] reductase